MEIKEQFDICLSIQKNAKHVTDENVKNNLLTDASKLLNDVEFRKINSDHKKKIRKIQERIYECRN